ncbi:olfactory receptor 1496-like [Pseudophryne corroboree]|uniref:olfactory receptor 1496-like n=1 Tax=Pseudophryne corroboree TaxID=495146 RepID=UPI0030817969
MSLLEYEAGMKGENLSGISPSFVFLGLLGVENYRYLYFVLALSLYIITMLLCGLIVYVIWAEESLHEPMYIFIGNLILNGACGNTIIFPQFIMNLLMGSSTISFPQCLAQIFCIQSFSGVEIFTFTTMAYDRYLAVCHPLRYSSLMTNVKALTYIFIFWIVVFILVLIPVILTAKLQFCGVNINNIFCDNMSLVRLACGSSSVNDIFGLIETLFLVLCSLLIIIYCYIRTLLICLKVSGAASLKAAHTLVTHIVTFSVFMTASLFVFLRYRLNGGAVSVTAHVILSITGLLTSVIVNPIVYGVRTEALKLKLIYNIKEMHILRRLSEPK